MRACKWTVYTNQLFWELRKQNASMSLALFTREKTRDELMDDWWQNTKMRGINNVAPHSQEREAVWFGRPEKLERKLHER